MVSDSSERCCPDCGEKLVCFHSPLDSLGCPECGSFHLTASEGWFKVINDAIVIDFRCLDCGFEWCESRIIPKRLKVS